ncbi:D-alanine-D-alanine ligase [Kitasatospora sp. MAP12-15]|uniref:D-alanine--D-alanine ligase family protein n=1 Tax=unclassified Kitasatospora TaxID=2633591 RepID=UPI0024756ED5|nr:ATP-grasp domain-containing protein [Kitasatospora sp. MAP12-44]MDH6111842.1 D-alanine-D-alanine ligase [Kitasatospora sp. MAP12-44]
MNIKSWLEYDPARLEELVRTAGSRMANRRVAVLYGGTSTEDQLYMESKPQSEWSVNDVLAGLRELGVDAEWLDPTVPGFTADVAAFDAAFLNVHGDFGEDGNLQGTLAYLGVPYTGSAVATSVIGADKRLTKLVLGGSSVAIPAYRRLAPGVLPNPAPACPVMLKAVNGGSSVGTVLVTEPDELDHTLRQLWDAGFDDVIAESFVDGATVTVSAVRIDQQVLLLPPIACVTDREYYDEYSKLHGEQSGTVRYEALTDPDDPRLRRLHDAAREILSVFDFEGSIRVDFILPQDGEPVLLELNTIPGVQHGSNLVLSAAAAGISYPDLLGIVLASASNTAKLAPWKRPQPDPSRLDGDRGLLPAAAL